MVDEKQVSEIVKNVIAGMDISSFDNKPARKQLGVFDTKLTRPLDIIIKNKGKIL